MKHSLRLLVLCLVGLFPITHFTSIAVAQNKKVDRRVLNNLEDEKHDDDHDHEGGIRIMINGKELEIDEEQIESFFEGRGEEIEAWAERHAEAWERWAEKFEAKMERWAEESEEEWEEWAEQYSDRWEKWGDKLEAGEIKGEELDKLLESNLEMLSEMPLGDLIEGALKNSLGELGDAPFESLDELGNIVGGAIEQSLETLEQELEGGIAGLDINVVTGKQRRGTENLNEALERLQGSLEKKRGQLEKNADRKLARMKELLARKKDLSEEDVDKIVEKLKDDLAASNAQEMQRAHLKLAKQRQGLEQKAAELALRKAKTAAANARNAEGRAKREMELARNIEREIRKKLLDDRNAAIKAKREMAQRKQVENDEDSEMDSLEAIYKKLKAEKEGLEKKESAIDQLRREIQELRKEIQRMKKNQKSD